MIQQQKNIPFAYFLTFRTYATWLHGDPRLSVDLKHNVYGMPRINPNAGLCRAMNTACIEGEFILNTPHRATVLSAIINTCHYYHWHLFAVHVRTNHCHVILQAAAEKESVRGKLKIYATKELKKNHPELSARKKLWSEGGSDQNIWASEFLFPGMYYVIEQQGEKMALYYEKTAYEDFLVGANAILFDTL